MAERDEYGRPTERTEFRSWGDIVGHKRTESDGESEVPSVREDSPVASDADKARLLRLMH